jgi:hypothetical protein
MSRGVTAHGRNFDIIVGRAACDASSATNSLVATQHLLQARGEPWTDLTVEILRVKVMCYRRSVGQSVLVSSTHPGPKTRFVLLSDSCGFVDVGRPLCREDRSIVSIAAGPRQRSHCRVPVPRDS